MVRAEPLPRVIARLDPTVLVLDVEGAISDFSILSATGDASVPFISIHPDMLESHQIDAMFAHLQGMGFVSQPIPDFGSHVALLIKRHIGP